MKVVIQKYLSNYAEPSIQQAQEISGSYDHVLVIPAYGECEGLIQTIRSVPGSRNLIIVVLNAPENPNTEHLTSNDRFKSQNSKLLVQNRIYLLDETHRFLPKKQGVGLARKLGCDLALNLIQRRVVRSSWIFTTDADALLPSDYFDRIDGQPVGACLFPFHHLDAADPGQTSAIRQYEAYMQSYVDGLKHAGSPYAYHSIGSTLSVHALSYAQVRGFPKRAAGEDFYILNKIRKVGSINSLSGKPILLSPRLSQRTPFGTGRAVADIASGEGKNAYPLEIFEELKLWLNILQQFSGCGALDLAGLRQSSIQFLKTAGVIENLKQHFLSRPKLVRKKGIFDYFDAQKTLRFINHLQRIWLVTHKKE